MDKFNCGTTTKRIGAIDSVRAIVLLGILLVHASGGFSFGLSNQAHNLIDQGLLNLVHFFLEKKCAVIFNVLFGVSFYFILKKPNYPSKKFIWRCVLLFVFGMINKLFYTSDALCWYAVCGIFLTLFRKFTSKQLILWAIFFRVIAIILSEFRLQTHIEQHERYMYEQSFSRLILYPYAYIDYFRSVLAGGVFGCISNFIIGYCIGKLGIIEQLGEFVKKKTLLITLEYI